MEDIKLSQKAQQICDRYEKNYVTDEQLLRYFELNRITQEEYDYIYAKHHEEKLDNIKEV